LTEDSTLPVRFVRPGRRMNPRALGPALDPAPPQPAAETSGTAVRVVRSVATSKVPSVLPWRRRGWATMPSSGEQSVFATITAAMAAARRYIYLEDQYFVEYTGGKTQYELYPYLRDAAGRGVKVVLLGSGVRDPEDPGIYLRPINRRLNRDLRRKLVGPASPQTRANIAMWRLEHCTVHSKLLLVDDVFACIGSANTFSRSMAGVDSEVSAAVSTTTALVRELRVDVWDEHLRADLDASLQGDLRDLDTALGMWRGTWSADAGRWAERLQRSALRAVWPN
jgi:phosphatidylserine/phosphatidylglycerophosphate/cardiolipin synthase-like enzyme